MSYISKSKCIFVSTATKTIQNTTDETTQFATGFGSTTVKAKSLSAWDTIEIRTQVRLSCGNGQQTTFRVYVNGVTLTSVGTLPNGLNQNQADFLYVLRVQNDWTLVWDWRTMINWGSWVTTASIRAFPYQPPITVDLNSDFDINITYQWANADPANILLVEQSSLHLNKM